MVILERGALSHERDPASVGGAHMLAMLLAPTVSLAVAGGVVRAESSIRLARSGPFLFYTCSTIAEKQPYSGRQSAADTRLPGNGNSHSHGARLFHQIITMMKCIRTSSVSMKNSCSLRQGWQRWQSARVVCSPNLLRLPCNRL